jgi:hypothetical protein
MYSQNGLLMAHGKFWTCDAGKEKQILDMWHWSRAADCGHVALVKSSRFWTCDTGQEQQIVDMWHW